MAPDPEKQTLSRRGIFVANFVLFCLVERTPEWNIFPKTCLLAHWINQTSHAFSRALFTLYLESKWSLENVALRDKCAQLGWIFLLFAEVLKYFMAMWVFGLVLWPFTVAVSYLALNTLLTLTVPAILILAAGSLACAIYQAIMRLNYFELRRQRSRYSMRSFGFFSNRTIPAIPEEPEPPEEEAPTEAGTKSLSGAEEEDEPVRRTFTFSPSKTRSGKKYI